jgi:pyruvate-formate lyase-activating enzyme
MFCVEPFYFILIKNLNNKLYLSPCCHINYNINDVNDLDINNPKIVQFRKTLLENDESKCYKQCEQIINKIDLNLLTDLKRIKNSIEISDNFNFNNFQKSILNKNPILDYKIKVSVNTDSFCNLKCPSCRKTYIPKTEDIFVKNYIEQLLQSKIINEQCIHLSTSNSNEPLYSDYSLYFLNNLHHTDIKDITLYTNGILLNESTLNKINNIHNLLHTISISIDAFNESTYSTIRTGGNMKLLKNNINYINSIKSLFRFKVRWNFVIQNKNILEIEDFIKWAIDSNVDVLHFSLFDKWYHTEEQYNLERVDIPQSPFYYFYKRVLPKIIEQYQSKITINIRL